MPDPWQRSAPAGNRGAKRSADQPTGDEGSTGTRPRPSTAVQGDLLADVAANTWPGSREQVEGIVEYLRKTRYTFTSDDVHDLLQRWPMAMHPNALGAILNGLARRGLIVEDGVERSRRPIANGRRIIRWRSADR